MGGKKKQVEKARVYPAERKVIKKKRKKKKNTDYAETKLKVLYNFHESDSIYRLST